jgi:xanthosine utilization system XapX-like protein
VSSHNARAAMLSMVLALVPAAAHAQYSEPAPRPAALMPLYGSFVGVQALDFDSTMRVLRSGAGREANPAIRMLAGSPASLIALKAGTTASIIFASERLRKSHHPVAAVVLMISVNSAYAIATAHNYAVLQRQP